MSGQQGNRNQQNHGLESRVASLETSIGAVVDTLDRLASEVHGLNQRVSAGTNWGVLGTWSAVLVSIIGGLGYLAISPIAEGVRSTSAELRYHERREGHPTMMAQFNALTKDYDEVKQSLTDRVMGLDAALQREMRDLDRSQTLQTEARLTALDKLLQTEIARVDDKASYVEAKVDALSSLRDKVDYWRTRAEAAERAKLGIEPQAEPNSADINPGKLIGPAAEIK